MKFPVCPNCQREWQDYLNSQWCYECGLIHRYPNLPGENVCRKLGGTKYAIYWYLDGRSKCIVMQNWIGGSNKIVFYDKCVSSNVVFPFDITEEQLEKLLVLL